MPSSRASDDLEKTVEERQWSVDVLQVEMDIGLHVPDHMPKRFSTERVSMVCIFSTSMLSSECFGRKGILAVLISTREVQEGRRGGGIDMRGVCCALMTEAQRRSAIGGLLVKGNNGKWSSGPGAMSDER